MADKVLGSTVQTHLNSSAPVLKHWHFVGANRHRWISVWLPAVSAFPSYSHSFPSSTVLFVFFLLSPPFTSWDIGKLTAELFHCTGPVPKQPAEEKKSSLSTEKLPLSSRKLSEECSQSLYCCQSILEKESGVFTSQDACKSVVNKVRDISSFMGFRCHLNNANYQLHCSVVTKLKSLGSRLGFTQINVFPKLNLIL